MSENMLWPHDEVREAKKLMDFIDREILTLEFAQAVDRDTEPDLSLAIAEYRQVKKQIEEAIAIVEKGG